MADNQPQDYVPRFYWWNHLIIEGNQMKCRYCQQKWDTVGRGNSTSTIKVHMMKFHLQELSQNDQ